MFPFSPHIRCLFRINPDRGSKAANGKAKHTTHPKVICLINKVNDYQWAN